MISLMKQIPFKVFFCKNLLWSRLPICLYDSSVMREGTYFGKMFSTNSNDALYSPSTFCTDMREDNENNNVKEIIPFKPVHSQLRSIKSFVKLKEIIETTDPLNSTVSYSVVCAIIRMHASRQFNVSDFKKFIKSEAFITFCNIIEKFLPVYDSKQLKLILYLCEICAVPESSLLFQKLLKLLIKNFNSFDLLQVLSLYKSMDTTYNNTDSARVLKLACLEYMISCFKNSNEKNNPKQYDCCFITPKAVVNLAYFAQDVCTPLFVKEKLILYLLEFAPQVKDPKCYYYMMKALSVPEILQNNKKKEYLIKKFLDNLKRIIKSSCPEKLIVLITKLYAQNCGTQFPYMEDLCDSITVTFGTSNYDIESSISLLKSFCKIPHLSISLLTYIRDKVCSAEFLSENHLSEINLSDLLFIFGTIGHSQLMKMECNIKNSPLLNVINSSKMFNSKYYKAVNLASLGIYNDDIIEQCLIKSVNSTEKKKADCWNLLLLHQSVNVFHPSYTGYRLPVSTLEKLAEKIRSSYKKLYWLDAIQNVFGSEKFVLTNCTTSLHHILSYVVVMDENNSPIDLSPYKTNSQNSLFNIDNIILYDNQKIFIIIEFAGHPLLHFRNVDALVGFGELYIQTVKKLGYNVISVYSDKFWNLTEAEKVPYITNLIEENFGKLNQNNDLINVAP